MDRSQRLLCPSNRTPTYYPPSPPSTTNLNRIRAST